MTAAPILTIIVAVKDSGANLHDFLKRLHPGERGDIEYIFAIAGEPPKDLVALGRSVKLLIAPSDTLVPLLWRDGIESAKGFAVALTTAQCLPSPDWVAGLMSADLSNFVGVGGAIDLHPACGPAHRAIYFLRYLAFAPPQLKREVSEIAADNAIYRRAEILEHHDLLKEGFWEPSFHRRFLQQRLRLQLDPGLSVTYRGAEPAKAFPAHRHLHGRAYGRWRADQASTLMQIAMVLASPLIPIVLMLRILRRAWSHLQFRASLPSAFPWLLWFVLAWSAGEAGGYLAAMRDRLLARFRPDLAAAS